MLALVASVSLSAQTFNNSKMYVEQNHKLKLVWVAINVQDEGLVATTTGRYPEALKIRCSEITALAYDRSKHRRWKTGVLISPLFLLSEDKKHWFAGIWFEEETVFQLSMRNFDKLLDAVESKTGKKVRNDRKLGLTRQHGQVM